MSRSRIVFATGGSGGHLFPAQALAADLLRENKELTLCFAGSGLDTNPYFKRGEYPYVDILSATPFGGGILGALKAGCVLFKGLAKSLKWLRKERPDLIVGFGSFHSFPILIAALLRKIPVVLFEANAVPGKVVGVLSRFATLTATPFAVEGKNAVRVKMPSLHAERAPISKQEACQYFGLSADRFTLLIFGGSQGARWITDLTPQLIRALHERDFPFQLLYFTGKWGGAEEIRSLCEQLKIPLCIKSFEPRMEMAWSAADVAVCRGGANTLAEQIHFRVPAFVIPYPYAGGHQMENALYVEKHVGGAVCIPQERATASQLAERISDLSGIKQMRETLQNQTLQGTQLSTLILELLKGS
ncbi:MAG: UDP-N-acetylglucosamine--N-acetylmuramyl-(pentapeptide) pyrophosphoryl-undecaprenol N-acetylglucosamine transferase [Verrucomicrobia bacterium]|nr:UDP-N-acetylglucosamine--N-acetylmuramyl-(pentapeptide) pyrophosphoryl-undecaprenol N-acetylglucosamine transferase [Verrucomicrobiota bacterium]